MVVSRESQRELVRMIAFNRINRQNQHDAIATGDSDKIEKYTRAVDLQSQFIEQTLSNLLASAELIFESNSLM